MYYTIILSILCIIFFPTLIAFIVWGISKEYDYDNYILISCTTLAIVLGLLLFSVLYFTDYHQFKCLGYEKYKIEKYRTEIAEISNDDILKEEKILYLEKKIKTHNHRYETYYQRVLKSKK